MSYTEPNYVNCKEKSYWSDRGLKKKSKMKTKRRSLNIRIDVQYCDGKKGRVVKRM